ncbi:MAG: hypothetical protein KDA98_17655, partial [Acidimicrobiales bacterium]|nr:hypothetical protein [Acidimicrobiales bacterium]
MSGTSARGAHAADPRRWFGPEDGPWFERDDWADGSRYRSADDARRAQATELRRTGVVTLPGAAPEALCREAIEALEPHFARTGAARLTNAAWALEPIRRLAQLPEVIELVTWLYGRTAIPFQTLDFRHGTEQAAHRDDEHF